MIQVRYTAVKVIIRRCPSARALTCDWDKMLWRRKKFHKIIICDFSPIYNLPSYITRDQKVYVRVKQPAQVI